MYTSFTYNKVTHHRPFQSIRFQEDTKESWQIKLSLSKKWILLRCNSCAKPWRRYHPASADCGIWFPCRRSCPWCTALAAEPVRCGTYPPVQSLFIITQVSPSYRYFFFCLFVCLFVSKERIWKIKEVLETSAFVDPVPFGAHQVAEWVERHLIVVEHQYILAHVHQLDSSIHDINIYTNFQKKNNNNKPEMIIEK